MNTLTPCSRCEIPVDTANERYFEWALRGRIVGVVHAACLSSEESLQVEVASALWEYVIDDDGLLYKTASRYDTRRDPR